MPAGCEGPERYSSAASDLGRVFGADLTEAELRYLARIEWAGTAQDVLWRRSKLGLRLSAAQAAEVEHAMGALTAAEPVDSASPHG